jgi:hypothetical protein
MLTINFCDEVAFDDCNYVFEYESIIFGARIDSVFEYLLIFSKLGRSS